MLRSDLIEKLEIVKPALATTPMIPLLTYYWFTGRELMAFNDQIAIATPFATDFRGAVPANLLDLLKVEGGSKDIDVSSEDGNLIVGYGRGRIRLAMVSPKEFAFKMPEIETDSAGRIIRELIDGVAHCLLSVGGSGGVAEQLGVTFENDADNDRRICLYSTDSSTVCRAFVSNKALQVPHRAIVPTSFCEQMLRLYQMMSEGDRDAGRASFRISSRKVRDTHDRFAMFNAGSVMLYGRLLETKSPLNFSRVLVDHLPLNFERALVQFPERLRGALERASIVCDLHRESTKIKVRDGRLFLSSITDHEEVEDDMPFADHDNISVSVEPRLLRRASDFDEILITKNCIILAKRKHQLLYLVSYQ